MNITKTDIRSIGTQFEPEGNWTGLLGLMEQKDYTVIPKMESFAIRANVVDFSAPFWNDQ